MRFARIDNAIKVCGGHLKNGTTPIELESYLVSYLLIIAYAEFEGALQKIIQARIARVSADAPLHTFIKSYIRKKSGETRLGRISVGDMGEILERFGKPCKTAFITEVNDKLPHQSWDLIVQNRHAIAHAGMQLQMSFRDFVEAYPHCQVVISAFARASGLTAAEIGRL